MSDVKIPRTNRSPDFSIVHVAAPQITAGGDFVYRLIQPDSALGRLPGVVTASITNIISRCVELCLGADILIIQLLGEPEMLPILLERRRAGRPTVFEISDNFMNFQPSNPAAVFYENPEIRAGILQLIAESDAAQTTVPELTGMFAGYNERIEVFENMIAVPGGVDKPVGPLTVGWGGSTGHYEDIRAAAPLLIAWLKRHSEARLSIMADPKFKELFTDAPPGSLLFRPAGTLDKYYDFVRSLHIGIAPLKDDPFNLCRSDVKFIEYASHGAVPVCSNTRTYSRTVRHGETGLLFSNHFEMIAHLDALAADPELRRKIAKQANDYIRTERSEQTAAGKRLAFYKSLLPENHKPGNITESFLKSIPSLRQTPGSRHFMHHFTLAEKDVYDAMVFRFNHGDAKSAEKSCRSAAAAEPDYFHPHFILGGLLLNGDAAAAETELLRALDIFPASCEARLFLSFAEKALGKAGESLETLRAIQRDCPKFAPAIAAEAGLPPAANDNERIAALMEKALEANPHYTPAALELGKVSLVSGNFERAEALFRRAAAILPRSAIAHYGLAAAHAALGKETEAVESYSAAISLAPDSEEIAAAFLAIPLKHYKSGDNKTAVALLARALDAAPEQPELLFWMVRIQERTNGEQAALPFRGTLGESRLQRKI